MSHTIERTSHRGYSPYVRTRQMASATPELRPRGTDGIREAKSRLARSRNGHAHCATELLRSVADVLPERVDALFRQIATAQPAQLQRLGSRGLLDARAKLGQVAARNAVAIARAELPVLRVRSGSPEGAIREMERALWGLLASTAAEMTEIIHSMGFRGSARGAQVVDPAMLLDLDRLRPQLADLAGS